MVSIIGAGPIGSYLAYLLAKNGFKVDIYEEHEKAGIPIQCTGIVTKELFKIIPFNKEYIVNEFNKVRVISKNNKTEIKLKEYLLNRTKFDNHLLKKAIKAGAKVHFSHQFIKYQKHKNNTLLILKNKDKIIKKQTKILIGADGPLSTVAQSAEIYKNRKFFTGMQAIVKGKFEKNIFTTYFGDIAPGFFAWIVPESDTIARIGVATRKNTNNHFKKILKQVKGKIIKIQGGPIPIYNHKQIIKKNNIYLVGDAAGFCKNTTGGGLVTGLANAKILANCIVNNKNYKKQLKKLKKQLKIHSVLRNMLDKFSNKDYNKLLTLMNNPKVKILLNKHKRDFPLKLLCRLLFAEPRFVCFIPLIFKKRKI